MKNANQFALFLGITLLTFSHLAECGSLNFDGIDDQVTVSDPVQLLGPLTLEAWVKVETATNGGRILSNRNGSEGWEIDIYDPGSGDPQLRFTIGGFVRLSATFPRSLIGTWAHIATSWEGPVGGEHVLYINGTPVNTGANTTPVTPTTELFRIGVTGSAGFGFFHGSIDEVRVWNTVIDPATMVAWFGRPLDLSHPAYANLYGYWNLDEGAGQAAASQVNNLALVGNLGTQAGADASDPTWETATPLPAERSTFGGIKAGPYR